ncbi:nucleotide disphospho-sugar-binding domain-containing protein [Nocardia neocaledoniensis]|uniref:nucleotide disphospho-sugar-binding domain-containing protein n=1 Tax=Nocardia neocaledoniensis TaxID=236511 RepID=UPI00245906A1|nr:nucleotide disphospho-sugar-binding domain-containing protein [Nocardia neocaledoniensis]
MGHLFPMVPLAWALRAAGHDVMVATAGQGLVAARSGLPAVDVAPRFDRKAMTDRLRREDPAAADRLGELRYRRLTDLCQAAEFAAFSSMPLVERTIALATRWRPEVIVQSQLQGAGLVAAGALGIPVINHHFGIAETAGMAMLLRTHMAAAFTEHGADVPARIATIEVAPPSVLDRPAAGWPMRYLPYNGGAVVPDWLTLPPDPGSPRVAVTFGTVDPRRDSGPVRRVIDTAAMVDAEFVLALGHVDVEDLGPLPANVRVVGWVPLTALLPSCAAIVHHGGAGTTLTALACGVPQVVFPGPMDRHINATAIARRGVGTATELDHFGPATLREVLTDVRMRRAAGEVRAEIAAMPGPADLVARVVEFAAGADADRPRRHYSTLRS